MARYKPRSRRRRRPRYRRKGQNRMRLYMVLTIVLCAAIVVTLKWQGDRSADPNDVNALSQEAATQSRPDQPNVPDPKYAVRPDPDVNQMTLVQPETRVQPAPVAPPVADDVNAEVDTVVSEAMGLLRQDPEGKLIEVRDRLNNTLDASMGAAQRVLIQGRLADLAQKWLFSAKIYPGDTLCETYKVQSGEVLQNIGRRYKVPYQLLMRINSIRRAQNLQAGAVIKVVKGPFNATVRRSSFTMDLYLQGKTYVKSYSVGLGLSERVTPTGVWIVRNDDKGKMERPEWTDPDTQRRYLPSDPDYPLGPCWIGLKGIEGEAIGRTGFAIHGTNEPGTIGTNASRGCIRLLNHHVVEVYNMMYPGFSKVTVED